MGELLNNLLKYCFIAIWFVAFFGGFYTSAAIVSTDVQKSLWRSHYRHSRTVEQASKYKLALQIPVYKSVLFFAGHPTKMLDRIKRTWPLLDHPSVAIGKGTIGPNIPDRILFYHVMPPPIIFLVIAGLLQGLAYPVARARLARSLATTDKKTFGKIKDLPLGDGFVLAEKVRLASDGGGNPHVLTIAPSGSGKSATQVIPSILRLPDDCSMIATDPKGELLARCAPRLKARGHKIYALGPLLGFGHGWDPLKQCRDEDEARELGRQILTAGNQKDTGNDDKWIKMSTPCFTSYLVQAWQNGQGLSIALRTLFEEKANGKSIKSDDAKLDYALYSSMGGETTAKSILATIQGAAAPWLKAKVVGWMASERQFTIDCIRQEKAAVFLPSSSSDMKATQAIQSVFFSMLFSRLAEGGEGRVRVFLDEFGNLGRLESIDSSLNLLRGADVSIHAFLQGNSQLTATYGRDAGAVTAEAFGTYCIMAGLKKDAEDLAKLLGMQDDVRANYATQEERLRAQYSQNQIQSMEGAMLRQIPKDQVLIISGNVKPVMAKLLPWFKSKAMKKRVLKKFWPDWNSIPQSTKDNFFSKFGKIQPKKMVLNIAEEPKKKPAKGGQQPSYKKSSLLDDDNQVDEEGIVDGVVSHEREDMAMTDIEGQTDDMDQEEML